MSKYHFSVYALRFLNTPKKKKKSHEEQLVLKCQIWNLRWPDKVLKSWREGKHVLQNTGPKSLMNSPPRLALFTDQVFGGRRPLPGCLLKPWLQQTLPWKRTVVKISLKPFSAGKLELWSRLVPVDGEVEDLRSVATVLRHHAARTGVP